MPFGTRFGNFPGSQELSLQLYLYFFCDFVFVELCICICIWSWWECTFGEIVTSYLSRREIQTPLSIRCHQAWPGYVTESSTAITNTKIQNKEIKTTQIQKDKEKRKKDLLWKHASPWSARECQRNKQALVQIKSLLMMLLHGRLKIMLLKLR